jgi:hypothetical protein
MGKKRKMQRRQKPQKILAAAKIDDVNKLVPKAREQSLQRAALEHHGKY